MSGPPKSLDLSLSGRRGGNTFRRRKGEASTRRGRLRHRPGWRPDLIHRPGVGTSALGGLVSGPPKSLDLSLSGRRGGNTFRRRKGEASTRRGRLRHRPGWRPDLIHRPGVGTSLWEGWCRARPNLSISPCQAAAAATPFGAAKAKLVPSTHMRCRITASFLASATFAFCMPCALGELRRPALQGAAFDRHGQDDMGGLVKHRAHALVSDLGDPPRDIGLPRLIFLRCHAEMRANRFR